MVQPSDLENCWPLEHEELVGRDLVGKFIGQILPHEHRREKDRVERNIVFADELDEFGLRVEPKVFPRFGLPVFCAHSFVAEM